MKRAMRPAISRWVSGNRSIPELVPDPQTLLALGQPELGHVILAHFQAMPLHEQQQRICSQHENREVRHPNVPRPHCIVRLRCRRQWQLLQRHPVALRHRIPEGMPELPVPIHRGDRGSINNLDLNIRRWRRLAHLAKVHARTLDRDKPASAHHVPHGLRCVTQSQLQRVRHGPVERAVPGPTATGSCRNL
jgi:hypothetical protein